MALIPIHIWLMIGTGSLMVAIFLFVFFVPYARLRRMVTKENWPSGGEALGDIRRLVGINLILGLITMAIAFSGPMLVY